MVIIIINIYGGGAGGGPGRVSANKQQAATGLLLLYIHPVVMNGPILIKKPCVVSSVWLLP